MSTAVDRRPSVDTRVGILPAQAPGLSRRDGAKVVEMFGGRDNLSEVERPATSAATDFRLNLPCLECCCSRVTDSSLHYFNNNKRGKLQEVTCTKTTPL